MAIDLWKKLEDRTPESAARFVFIIVLFIICTILGGSIFLKYQNILASFGLGFSLFAVGVSAFSVFSYQSNN